MESSALLLLREEEEDGGCADRGFGCHSCGPLLPGSKEKGCSILVSLSLLVVIALSRVSFADV